MGLKNFIVWIIIMGIISLSSFAKNPESINNNQYQYEKNSDDTGRKLAAAALGAVCSAAFFIYFYVSYAEPAETEEEAELNRDILAVGAIIFAAIGAYGGWQLASESSQSSLINLSSRDKLKLTIPRLKYNTFNNKFIVPVFEYNF